MIPTAQSRSGTPSNARIAQIIVALSRSACSSSEASVAPVVAAVTAIVTAVPPTVVTTVDTVRSDHCRAGDRRRPRHRGPDHTSTSSSCSSQWHRYAPSLMAASSASIDAMIAWIGILPVAISCPPARRAAEANGAAQMFSQTSTPAVLPFSIASAR